LNSFTEIQKKLQQFIKKYYFNELIKGLLLFFAIGLLYFIFTLLIEHFLWLKPTARTILFVLFIVVEIALLFYYILIPIFKIYGLRKGINEIEASKLIGNYFPEVNDKLLNMIQLKNVEQNSELIEASIEQKSNELNPIPFKRAIDFTTNKKYIKYALIPVVIWLLILITGNITIFNNSLSRVVNYQTQYQPPAPFSFNVLNDTFDVIEGESFTVKIETVGDVIPEDCKIYFLNENYYLENKGLGTFEYTFSSIKNSFDFYIEANGITSNYYKINMLATPVITNLKMVLNYPEYTGKQNEVIQNTGNAIVPEGTNITWQIASHQTNQIIFNSTDKVSVDFKKVNNDYFNYTSKIVSSINYNITTSNEQLKAYEKLDFSIQSISDEFPKIIVQSDIDSISRGPAQFIGQLSDDYGVKKLQLVYYLKKNPSTVKTHLINVSQSTFTDFYYVFPDGINVEDGLDYEFYFEVFDNDAVNGSKKSSSKKFSFYKETNEELKDALLKEQNQTISNVSKSLEESKEANTELNKFKNEIQKKADINWNDTQKLEEFMKRQNQYQEMFQKQTEELEQNLDEQPVSEELKEQKEDLQKRIEETKKLADQQKLLDELNKLSEKLDKEDLLEKLDDIVKKNKQNEQSLERILELTKRFYVEQKANQISEKLEKLSEEQKTLSKLDDEENSSEKQKEVNKEFDEIKEDFKELNQQNKDLMRPMKLPDNSDEIKDVDSDLEKALDELEQNENSEDSEDSENSESNKSSAKKSQKSASKKMKEMSQSMAQSMEGSEGEMIDENIDDLRKIVENLLEFSFQQEDLMEEFSSSDNNHPDYPKRLKQQFVLKEYFEHIDDSLYMLSLRLVKMGTEIQKEVSEVHYNIDKALENFPENRLEQAISNQHFVITSANNLADNLSDLLESLMNASSSMGKGKGKGSQPEFSLPDIIKKQGELNEKMKEGMKPGEKPGDKSGDKNKGEINGSKPGDSEGEGTEEMNEALYQIYKEQAQLRDALNKMLGNKKGDGENGASDVMKQMEELENEMLEKGFSQEVFKKMQQLNYELLKLEEAQEEQGEDEKRESETNIQSFEKRNIEKIKLNKEYFNTNEILNRQSLPLRSIYKKKVQEYFKNEE